MMTDIPEDVLKAAQEIANSWAASSPFNRLLCEDIVDVILAERTRCEAEKGKAIAEAVAAERERCTELIDWVNAVTAIRKGS